MSRGGGGCHVLFEWPLIVLKSLKVRYFNLDHNNAIANPN